jgi:hypothetical protein
VKRLPTLPFFASDLTRDRKVPRMLIVGALIAGALLSTGCSSTTAVGQAPTISAPSARSTPSQNLTSLQDVLRSHPYLTDKERQSHTERMSASVTAEVSRT